MQQQTHRNQQIISERDPDLGFGRVRIDAESIRDAVLQMSGKMDLTMGGPSARQFIETPGIQVTPTLDYANFNPDDPANHRRSVYRFLFRTLPDPFMESMDCPDHSQLTPVRSTSVTALQALANIARGRRIDRWDPSSARSQAALPGGPDRG